MDEPKDVEIPDNFTIDYLEMSDGAKLRYFYYHPENANGHVLLYPGMNTLVLSWIRVLELLTEENFAIDYVESREKHTSKLDDYKSVNKERMLLDCVEVIELLDLKDKPYIALGSSLGSTTFIHTMADHRIAPKYAILVGPSAHFNVSFGMRLVLPFLNNWTYEKFGRPILKKLALRKYTNEDADPKQKRKYSLALDLADPMKMKSCVYSWNGNKVYDDLSEIDGEKTICYLIGASEDILHPDHETRAIAEKIDNSKFVDLKTNTAAHDRPLVDLIINLE